MVFLAFTTRLAGQVTDNDNKSYSSVKIGKQEWITENLNVSHFRNGDSIPEAEGIDAWHKASDEKRPAWCYYNGNVDSGRKFHKLYNWYAVNDPRGLAPDGWHIPSTKDWTDLITYLGGQSVAGTKMKSPDQWDATNASGFVALPGGYRNSDGIFNHVGKIGSWWSASEADPGDAWSLSLAKGTGVVSTTYDAKRVGLSVRCLRN
jgi:uncharacterized protein (TIGR02145 family)